MTIPSSVPRLFVARDDHRPPVVRATTQPTGYAPLASATFVLILRTLWWTVLTAGMLSAAQQIRHELLFFLTGVLAANIVDALLRLCDLLTDAVRARHRDPLDDTDPDAR